MPVDPLLLVLQRDERRPRRALGQLRGDRARDEVVERRREQLEHLADAVAVGESPSGQSSSKSNAACSPVPVCVERAAWTMSGQAVATVLNASASCVQPFFSAIENSRNASSLTSSASIAPSGRCLRARQKRAGGRQAVALQERDQVVQHLPRADAVVGEHVVVLRQVRPATAA